MNISRLKGLRYPDEYVIRWFYKEGLERVPGRVLELGCGDGNNLLPFVDYGWDVVGIDYDENSIANGRHNLENAGYALEQGGANTT
jgi:SAM-dependent methyltransferase